MCRIFICFTFLCIWNELSAMNRYILILETMSKALPYVPQRSVFRKCIGAHIKSGFWNYMKMWRPKCTGSRISLSTGMNLRSSCKETLMIVYGSEVFRCGARSRDSFSPFVFAHIYAFARAAQTATGLS